MKTVVIKLTKVNPKIQSFTIKHSDGTILFEGVTKKELIKGFALSVEDDLEGLFLVAENAPGTIPKFFTFDSYTKQEISSAKAVPAKTGSIWRHIDTIMFYNTYYGKICPYILEYPSAYKNQDEIVQNVKDYTKVFKYLQPEVEFDRPVRIETDEYFFNKAILWNNQQSSGILELVIRPKNNLSAYSNYPVLNPTSKSILLTKSDNFYQFNTFWALNSSSQIPIWNSSKESLSIDKEINQANMDYSTRSFRKATIRAKDSHIRYIMDNRNDIHLVSQFLIEPTQVSFK